MLDYIVVGSGIGSFCICKRLADTNKSFVVVSDFNNSATSAAGGIINPIILKRFKPFWKAVDFFNEATSFYNHLQNISRLPLITQKEVFRIFSSIEEQNDWYSKSDQPVLDEFLVPETIDQINGLKSAHKIGLMKQVFLADAKKILHYFHHHFLTSNSCFPTCFDHQKLVFHDKYIAYKHLTASKIIFCEGFKAVYNPFFSYLPIYGNRGDYLIFKSPELKIDHLVKGKEFIIPLGDDFYKFGASFDRHFLSDYTPDKFKDQLIDSLKRKLKVNFQVVRFESGIRPNVKDRKPLLGRHPYHQQMYIMNGFGSRGLFMSPLLSKWMYNYLENNIKLPDEVNIKRFQSYF